MFRITAAQPKGSESLQPGRKVPSVAHSIISTAWYLPLWVFSHPILDDAITVAQINAPPNVAEELLVRLMQLRRIREERRGRVITQAAAKMQITQH